MEKSDIALTMQEGSKSKITVLKRLDSLGIKPNENLGQHFLVDDETIKVLQDMVIPGNTVIEVGSGVGQLTEALAGKASRVVTIELDRRYKPVLQEISSSHPNIEFLLADALTIPLENYISGNNEEPETQIVSSLPFHISEPFLHKIIGLPFYDIVLVVGDRLGYALTDKEGVTKLSILARTFFETEIIMEVDKKKFYPIPRTNSVIVRLIPKTESDFRSDRKTFILRRLFLTAKSSPLVKNCIKEALIDFKEESGADTLSKKELHRRNRRQTREDLRGISQDYNTTSSSQNVPNEEENEIVVNKLTQNEARNIINQMGIPEAILEKPLEQLNNEELKILYNSLV